MAGARAGSRDPSLQKFELHILVRLVDCRETRANDVMVSALLAAAAFPTNRFKGIKDQEHLFCFYSARQFRKSLSGHWLIAEIMEQKLQRLPTTKNTHLAILVWKSHKWMAVALMSKVSNSWEAEESDFQSYHIIILRMSSSQQKNCKVYKETQKYGPSTGKKFFDRNHPWESPDTGIISQRR